MARMTREEKSIARQRANDAERAARAAADIAEFREKFTRACQRRIYDDRVVWQADRDGDRTAMALYSAVDEYKRIREQLGREMRACREALDDMLLRFDRGQDPMYWSNGLTGRYGVDIDKYSTQAEAVKKTIVTLAYAGRWRVREIESAAETAKADRLATAVIQKESDDKWRIKFGFDYATMPGSSELLPGYDTEDDAWRSLRSLI